MSPTIRCHRKHFSKSIENNQREIFNYSREYFRDDESDIFSRSKYVKWRGRESCDQSSQQGDAVGAGEMVTYGGGGGAWSCVFMAEKRELASATPGSDQSERSSGW